MTNLDISFAPPGPGYWELDSSHRGRRPLSPYLTDTALRAVRRGTTELFSEWGLPLEHLDVQLVHGCVYTRAVAVGEGSSPSSMPPRPLAWLFTRLHPEMRRRNRFAAEAFDRRRWRDQIQHWFSVERATVVGANRSYQSVDLSELDDQALIRHLDELLAHFEEQATRNLATHGADAIPIGDFLAHCEMWGVPIAQGAGLLAGSSPATLDPPAQLAPLASLMTGSRPESTDDVRALGEGARAIVDEWLTDYAWRLVTSDDLDGLTLAELPVLQLQILRSVAPIDAPNQPDPGPVRAHVPSDKRDLFDSLLAEAQHAQTYRDDNVGVRWNWTAGLMRRALLDAGRRLVHRGQLTRSQHAIELTPAELQTLLTDNTGPSAEEAAHRLSWRDQVQAAQPPLALGPPEPLPPLEVFPGPMARATRALLTVLGALDRSHDGAPLHGVGIGDAAYTGRACVIKSHTDLDDLQPGDVIVAPFTGPAYNTVLNLAGALVVEDGGPLSHAAIAAREFGLPAVIGAAQATTQLTSGALVEVHPIEGTVRNLSDQPDASERRRT